MPKYYYDTLQNQAIELDDPEAIAQADADQSAIPLLSKEDKPFQRPVQFRVKDTGETLSVQSRAAYDEALKDRTVDLITTPTPSEAFAAARKERAEVEMAARRAASSFGEQIADSTLATLYGYGGAMLPGIFPAIREIGGVTPEEQEVFRKEYAVASGLGTLAGIGGQIAATGGMGVAARAAGATAAAEAAAAGGGRIAQGLAAARAAGGIPLTAGEAAAAPLGVGTRVSEAVRAGLTAAAPAAAETVLGKTALGATAAAASALPLAAAYEFDESNLENRAMSSEAVLHNAMLAGALGTIEGTVPLLRGIGTSETGQKLASSLGKSQAMRLINRFDRRFFKKAADQIGEENIIKRINSATDQGYIGLGKSAGKSLEDIRRGMDENGAIIGELADEAAQRGSLKGMGPQDVSSMLDRISDELVVPLRGPGSPITESERNIAGYLAAHIDNIKEAYPDGMTPQDLANARTLISNEIYGLKDLADPTRTPSSRGLRRMRTIMTDELVKMFENAGIDKRVWKRAQDQYGVLSTAEDLVERGLINEAKATGINDRTAAIAASIASYKGIKPILSGLAGVIAKREGNLAYDWAQGALRKALESGAPKQTIDALQRLSEEQASEAAARLAGLGPRYVAPDVASKSEFWRLSSVLDAAARDSSIPAETREAVRSAQSALRSFKNGRMTNLMGVSSAAPDALANELERASSTLSSASRSGRGRIPSEEAASSIRAIRDQIDASLSNARIWGPERFEKAQDLYRDIIAARTDPVRVAALEGLDEATRNLRIKTTSKVDRLFGESGVRRAVTLAPTMSEAYASERRRFKERVFKHHFEPKKELVLEPTPEQQGEE